ncbi:hypothetical protein PENTCL1PPCAC_23861, partial [Pristionchus entomophagus]
PNSTKKAAVKVEPQKEVPLVKKNSGPMAELPKISDWPMIPKFGAMVANILVNAFASFAEGDFYTCNKDCVKDLGQIHQMYDNLLIHDVTRNVIEVAMSDAGQKTLTELHEHMTELHEHRHRHIVCFVVFTLATVKDTTTISTAVFM